MNNEYTFAPLSGKTLEEVKSLENKLNQEVGENITLIAYSKKAVNASNEK